MPASNENDGYQYYYCPKCGQSSFLLHGDGHRCSVCETLMIKTPKQYCLTMEKMQENYDEFNQNEQRLFDEVISRSPEFDEELYHRKDEIIKQNRQLMEEAIAHGKVLLRKEGNQVKCTYCQSTNVKKIGLFSRVVSTELFGLGSKKIGKQWHCNNCGSGTVPKIV